jgi:hypothetical protein
MKILKTNNKQLSKYILVGVCATLAISSVFMTIETATSSAEVSALRKEEAVLLDTKRDLEDNLVRSLSLSQLQLKSVEMGFAKPSALVYTDSPEVVAKLP